MYKKLHIKFTSDCARISTLTIYILLHLTKYFTSQNILPHKIFYLTKYFTSQNILPHKIFYLTKYFTSQNILPHKIFYLTRLSHYIYHFYQVKITLLLPYTIPTLNFNANKIFTIHFVPARLSHYIPNTDIAHFYRPLLCIM